jgi:hypothetical protein
MVISMPENKLSDYYAFLQRKIRLSEDAGVSCDHSDINPVFKPHQADMVVWGVNGGRRAYFASFATIGIKGGFMLYFSYASKETTSKDNLRNLRNRVRVATLSTWQRRGQYCSRACWYEAMRRGSKLHCALCDSEFYRSKSEQDIGTKVNQFCSQRLLYGVARNKPVAILIPKMGRFTSTGYCCFSYSWAPIETTRGCSSYRFNKNQQPSFKSSRIPISENPHTMSFWGDVR